MVSRGAKRLFERLGRVVVVALGVVFLGAAIAYHAEHPTNPEFATFGDALWWGIVTLTTVGYGDIVPKTSVGRGAGVMIMLTGIAVVGLLAGSLASFFRFDGSQTGNGSSLEPDTDLEPAPSNDGEVYETLIGEMARLREQMAHLTEQLARGPTNGPRDAP